MTDRKHQLIKKKPKEAAKQPPTPPTIRVNIGAVVDRSIWMKFRAAALMEGITAGELLDKAMDEYLKKCR